jgi:hypothetical protein
MKKKAEIDKRLESDGWSGTITRLTVMILSLVGIYALPFAFAWYSENVLLKKVEIKGYEFALNVAFFMFGVVVLFEVINGIRLFRISRKKRKEHA